jgi:hypothetical protein
VFNTSFTLLADTGKQYAVDDMRYGLSGKFADNGAMKKK